MPRISLTGFFRYDIILSGQGEDTHYTKQNASAAVPQIRKGETPIMKNTSADAGRFRVVRVFDGFGNEQDPTYIKRAKGLVKNGRAQWCGEAENAIVLLEESRLPSAPDMCTVPHSINTEDTEMSELMNKESFEAEEDLTLKSLLERLSDLAGAIADCDDTEQITVIGKLYTDTLDVIKDIKKQNQEVKLAQLKCAKE